MSENRWVRRAMHCAKKCWYSFPTIDSWSFSKNAKNRVLFVNSRRREFFSWRHRVVWYFTTGGMERAKNVIGSKRDLNSTPWRTSIVATWPRGANEVSHHDVDLRGNTMKYIQPSTTATGNWNLVPWSSNSTLVRKTPRLIWENVSQEKSINNVIDNASKSYYTLCQSPIKYFRKIVLDISPKPD